VLSADPDGFPTRASFLLAGGCAGFVQSVSCEADPFCLRAPFAASFFSSQFPPVFFFRFFFFFFSFSSDPLSCVAVFRTQFQALKLELGLGGIFGASSPVAALSGLGWSLMRPR